MRGVEPPAPLFSALLTKNPVTGRASPNLASTLSRTVSAAAGVARAGAASVLSANAMLAGNRSGKRDVPASESFARDVLVGDESARQSLAGSRPAGPFRAGTRQGRALARSSCEGGFCEGRSCEGRSCKGSACEGGAREDGVRWPDGPDRVGPVAQGGAWPGEAGLRVRATLSRGQGSAASASERARQSRLCGPFCGPLRFPMWPYTMWPFPFYAHPYTRLPVQPRF